MPYSNDWLAEYSPFAGDRAEFSAQIRQKIPPLMSSFFSTGFPTAATNAGAQSSVVTGLKKRIPVAGSIS